jgi:hypothetical protein
MRLIISIFILSLSIATACALAPAGGSLPHSAASATIKGKPHAAIRNYFASLGDAPELIDTAVERLIVAAIPKNYFRAADSIALSWAPGTKGTARRMIRVLHLETISGGGRQAFITYTAFSSLAGNRYYDERLCLLTIDSLASTLSILATPPLCADCQDLTRIGLDDTTHIGGFPAVSFLLAVSNNNPCCPTPDSLSEDRLLYFWFPAGGATQALSLLKHRRELRHGVHAQDTLLLNSVDNYLEKDGAGNITKVVSTNTFSQDDKPVNQRIVTYMWNPKMRRFVTAQ